MWCMLLKKGVSPIFIDRPRLCVHAASLLGQVFVLFNIYAIFAKLNKTQAMRIIYIFLLMVSVFFTECDSRQSSSRGTRAGFARITSRESDSQIQKSEKRYALVEAENEALKYGNRVLLVVLASLCIVLPLLLIGWQRQQMKIKAIYTEQKCMLLQQQQESTEQRLLCIEFMLAIYQQISGKNTAVKALLSYLKTHPHVSKKEELVSKIAKVHAGFSANTAMHPEMLPTSKFEELTGIRLENPHTLNANEKMLLLFSSMNLDNRQIAILFTTTESSIRGRKAKLRAKVESWGIDIKGIIL